MDSSSKTQGEGNNMVSEVSFRFSSQFMVFGCIKSAHCLLKYPMLEIAWFCLKF